MAPAQNAPAVRAVLFDLYGTLIDITVDTSLPETWKKLAKELAGLGLSMAAEALRARYWELVQAEERAHGQAFVLDPLFFTKLVQVGTRQVPRGVPKYVGRIFRELTTQRIQVRPYALPLLQAIRESGCKLGLVSNTEETVTRHDLQKLKLDACWDTIVLSASVGVKKPHPEIFHIALRKLGTAAQQAVFVGDDRVADFEGAKSAGISPVLLCPMTGRSPFTCTNPRLECILASLERCGWTRSAAHAASQSSFARRKRPGRAA